MFTYLHQPGKGPEWQARAYRPLVLHLMSEHGFTPHVLTRTSAELIDDHEREHSTVRNHRRFELHFDPDRVDRSFAAAKDLAEFEAGLAEGGGMLHWIPEPRTPGGDITYYCVTKTCAGWGQRPAKHAIGEVLTAAYAGINEIAAVSQHGDITRRSALDIIINLAREHGVAL